MKQLINQGHDMQAIKTTKAMKQLINQGQDMQAMKQSGTGQAGNGSSKYQKSGFSVEP